MKVKLKKGFTLVEIMIVVAIIGLLAAIAIPSFIKSRNTARKNTCINNLRLIDAAKEQWTFENPGGGSSPGAADLEPYMKGETMPKCPSDDSDYVPGNIGTNPTCPNAAALGHELPVTGT